MLAALLRLLAHLHLREPADLQLEGAPFDVLVVQAQRQREVALSGNHVDELVRAVLVVDHLAVHDAAVWREDLGGRSKERLASGAPSELLSPLEPTSADRTALPFLQAPPDLSLVTTVTEAGCPTRHSSSPAPMASLWLATALMKTSREQAHVMEAGGACGRG